MPDAGFAAIQILVDPVQIAHGAGMQQLAMRIDHAGIADHRKFLRMSAQIAHLRIQPAGQQIVVACAKPQILSPRTQCQLVERGGHSPILALHEVHR